MAGSMVLLGESWVRFPVEIIQSKPLFSKHCRKTWKQSAEEGLGKARLENRQAQISPVSARNW